MTETSALLTALAFARKGHAVFPVNWPVEHRGRLICSCGSDSRGRPCGKNAAKHPYGKLAPNGLLSATIETGVIKHWWGYLAPEANLGVVTDRLIVVDIDPRHDGDESFRALEREHGEMPTTWRVLTGGGGEHVLFACPDGVEISNVVAELMDDPPLGRGIDIRARSGYIIAPPSRHISGRPYAWSVDHHPADVPLANPPDWLLACLTARSVKERQDATPPEVWQRLTESVRDYPDAAAAQVAGHLLRRWVNPYLVAGLLHAWNQTYVRPPLADDELRRILDRVARLEDQRRDAAQQGGERAKA
jgi:Bifunctional DNA primase/polymerase, N-terminal/Primase C terminal 1 (PriCT-1)